MMNATDGRPPAHHGPDGRFRNPPGSPRSAATGRDMWRFFGQMWREGSHVENPLGHALDPVAVGAAVRAAPNPSITWLGHAAFLIRSAGKVVLTDPFLGDVAGPRLLGRHFGPRRHVPPAIAATELRPIDLLLLSHNHYDHLDEPTLKVLARNPQTEVVRPLGLARMMRKLGFASVHALDWWQERTFDNLAVHLLPAVHFSGRGPFDRKKTLWGSFGLHADDARIWFSGDSATGDVFREIGETAGPFDLGLVGIGAYEPRHIMQASHATPEEAVGMLRAVRAARGVGMHWGTIKLTTEDPFEAPHRFKAAAREQGYGEDNAIVLKIGETLPLKERPIALAAE